MDFSLQETAEVILAIIIFSLLIHIIFQNMDGIQNQIATYITTWSTYGI